MENIPTDIVAARNLAAYILHKSNLQAQWEEIFYSIEEGLRETYSEDELTDVGNIYVLYKALEDGHFSDELDTGLNADQKQYLLSMSVYKTLEFKVIRRDCLVNIVTIPLHLGSSANHNKFKFTITLEASLDADEILGVGGEYSGISKDGFLKFASAYQA
jgi:hypothetical protein